MAVNDISRIVDVERHRCGCGRVAGTVEINHHANQADEIAQGRRILPTRDGRLRTEAPRPVSDKRPQAGLNAGSNRSRSRLLASSWPQAMAQMPARRMSGSRYVTRSATRS